PRTSSCNVCCSATWSMAKPIMNADEAMVVVTAMAMKGFIIQQLSPYHFRIPFRHDLYVDWWPTTATARLVTGQGGHALPQSGLSHELHPILIGLHYAVHGKQPEPVVLPHQQERHSGQ